MKLNILVVDDNRMMREMVSRAVRMSDAGGRRAAPGRRTARRRSAAMRAGWVDLVLLDINMPVMDGETFLRALRADTALRDALVVVVSTESSQPRIARLAALGAGFVHKPFRPEELVTEVDRQLTGRSLRAARRAAPERRCEPGRGRGGAAHRRGAWSATSASSPRSAPVRCSRRASRSWRSTSPSAAAPRRAGAGAGTGPGVRAGREPGAPGAGHGPQRGRPRRRREGARQRRRRQPAGDAARGAGGVRARQPDHGGTQARPRVRPSRWD